MITFVYSRLAEFSGLAKSSEYFLDTEKSWILQTYLKMRSHGFSVVLAPVPPTNGAFIACASKMPPDFIPGPEQCFLSVSADGPPHVGADVHIVQNKAQRRLLPDAIFVPHWPQPGLVGRDPSRGVIFENVAYIGDATNLDPALRSPGWSKKLERMGMNWIVPSEVGRDPADMRDIDCVVAVRSFQRTGFIRKPASKLVNALLADVPAICGPEFAFREVGRRGSCFLEVRTAEQALGSIEQLKVDLALRRRLVADGRLAVQAYNETSVLSAWKLILELCVSGEILSRKTKFPEFRAVVRRKILGLQHICLKSIGLENLAL